ncbi:hypothetical protein GCM10022254_51450 [Actinomadura meridiana]|uniref:Uncharacterized protein n=1 Tax=Actinomadura meridiana TaxID=559626 RepID=A0ABP8CD83_9ACTN
MVTLGIQPADVQELLDQGCTVIVLTRGMRLRPQTMPETLKFLEDNGIEVHIKETTAAVELYNKLAQTKPVGARPLPKWQRTGVRIPRRR